MPLTPAEGVAYGAIQGVTEILPISSSAHLVLLPWLVGWEDPGLGFDVALHFGTFVAIVGFFWREWLQIATGLFTSLAEGRLASTPGAELFWKLVVASVPAAIVGLALESEAGTIFRAPLLIAATLAGFGGLLWLADRTPATREGLEAIGWREALLIGSAQALAIVPGVSRSGVTMTAARFTGVDRATSARFSFLLGTPVVGGATLLKAADLGATFRDPGALVALVASAVFGATSIALLLGLVRRVGFTPFVAYRLLLAAVILAAALGPSTC